MSLSLGFTPRSILVVGCCALLARAAATGARSVPKGVLVAPIIRIENQSAYGLQFGVGTPPQINVLKIDSGSSTISFQDPKSSECQQSNEPCALYGSFNNLSSSTSIFVSSDGFDDELIDHASGGLLNDTLRFAGTVVENITFGMRSSVAASYSILAPDAAIVGLGQDCSDDACDDYNTLQQQLYDRGIVNNRAFGLYLGPDEPNATGSLVFSGFDRAKQADVGFTLDVVDPASADANNGPFSVNVTSYSISVGGNKTTIPLESGYVSVVDTGNPRWAFPDDVYSRVADYLNVNTSSEAYQYGPFVVDCKFRQPTTDSLTIAFTEDKNVTVTMDKLVTQIDTDLCATFITPGTNLGDAFLRSVYTIFDMDHRTITFSNVAHVDKEVIVALPNV